MLLGAVTTLAHGQESAHIDRVFDGNLPGHLRDDADISQCRLAHHRLETGAPDDTVTYPRVPVAVTPPLEHAVIRVDETQATHTDGIFQTRGHLLPPLHALDRQSVGERVASVEAHSEPLRPQPSVLDDEPDLIEGAAERTAGARRVLQQQPRAALVPACELEGAKDGLTRATRRFSSVGAWVVADVGHHSIGPECPAALQLIGKSNHGLLAQLVVVGRQIDQVCRVSEDRAKGDRLPCAHEDGGGVRVDARSPPLTGALRKDLHALAPDRPSIVECLPVPLRNGHVSSDQHQSSKNRFRISPLYGARYTFRMEPPRRESFTPRPWTGRAILHVDLDAFFASVEQLDHPEWRGLPVIVGGDPNRRGVVSTASYEARRFGIHSAMSSARAAQLCPNAIWAPSRFDRYREFSSAVFAILRDVSPLVQPVSVDEAFLDVTPGRHASDHPVDVAETIRRRIAELGLTASVGVATSKTVAKIASDHQKPDGLTVVWPGGEAEFLAPLPVRAMSGIGPRTAGRLEAFGVRTLGRLSLLDDVTAREVLGAGSATVLDRARGIDDRPVRDNEGVKSVSNERTFAVDVRTPQDVDSALEALAVKVGSRLRGKALAGRTVTVKLRFADFTTRTVRRTLEAPTDDETVFLPVARTLVREAWSPGVGLRLLGVGVSGFDSRTEQLPLIQDAERAPAGRRELVQGIDAVRSKFGPDALRFGREVVRETLAGHEPEGDREPTTDS